MLTAGALFATSACGGNTTVPSGVRRRRPRRGASSVVPNDTTSILKKLTKDVEIGSTVDPKNGDMGPRAISRGPIELRAQERAAARLQLRRLCGHCRERHHDRSTRSSPALQAGDLYAKHQDRRAATAMRSLRQITSTARGWLAVSFREFNSKPASSRRVTVLPSRLRSPTPMHSAVRRTRLRTSTLGIPRRAIIKLAFVPVSSGHAQVTQVISGFGVNKGSGWSALRPIRNPIQ
jgi:hypothetical protein